MSLWCVRVCVFVVLQWFIVRISFQDHFSQAKTDTTLDFYKRVYKRVADALRELRDVGLDWHLGKLVNVAQRDSDRMETSFHFSFFIQTAVSQLHNANIHKRSLFLFSLIEQMPYRYD